MKLKKFILSLKLVQWFLVKVLPVMRFSFAPPKMTDEMFYQFLDRLQPGDIIFSCDRSKLAGKLIPGRWDHAAIYIGHGRIVEAHQPFVRMVGVFSFCHTSDEVGIARFAWPDLSFVIYHAEKAVGRRYDSWFDDETTEALYCSELVAALDDTNEMGIDKSDFLGLGVPYVAPDDLWEARNIVRVMG